MQTKWMKATLFAVFTMSGIGAALAQQSVDKFQPLIEVAARRLALGEQVALSKWDSGAAVEDPVREGLVINDAMKKGESNGLERSFTSNFFKAQIEANKIVQYSMLADWRRSGNPPSHAPIDLVKTIRPQLDEIQLSLIAELANTADIRAQATCPADIAKAVGRYFSAHRQDVEQLREIALDRALAVACTR
jgi:chorismate mutase